MIRLAVGLGNPGPKYSATRHNLGRLVVEQLASRVGEKFKKETDGARVASVRFSFGETPPLGGAPTLGEKLTSGGISSFRLAILGSFMNESGPALVGLLRYHKFTMTDLLIVFDDFSLPFGTIRLRHSGSAGGHNGMKSIIETLGTQDFPRLRLGIGPVPTHQDPADFVLERFRPEEKAALPDFITRATNALEAAVLNLDRAMNQYNRSPEPSA